jgi:hypothetical protein
MKTIATGATERSIPAEDALRLVIDATPAERLAFRHACSSVTKDSPVA